MSGQIVDATLVAAPKQRNTRAEKDAIKAGARSRDLGEEPAKLGHKDREARWTLKFTKAKDRAQWPRLGRYRHSRLRLQEPLAIDRQFGLIRPWQVTDAVAYDGAQLRDVLIN